MDGRTTLSQRLEDRVAIEVDDALGAALDSVRGQILRSGEAVMPTRQQVCDSIIRMAMADPKTRSEIGHHVATHLKMADAARF